MKKLLLSVLLLTGCQTASHLGSMSQAGMSSLSCPQIYTAFNAYKQDRYSVDAWLQLVNQVNPELGATTSTASRTAEERYQQAKMYANVALAVQGCQPL